MLLISVLLPLIMFAFGILTKFNIPKHPNSFFGYRTTFSQKNGDTWRFAQNYFGKIWRWVGGCLFVISTGVYLGFISITKNNDEISSLIGMILMMVNLGVLIGTIYPTEAALKRNFDSSGNRKIIDLNKEEFKV